MSQKKPGPTTKYLRDKKNIYVISVMKEKNIILTARIMSMIFTPFYLPMVGLIALVHLQLYVAVTDRIQTGDAGHGLPS